MGNPLWGRASESYIFRCRQCGAAHHVESKKGHVTLENASKWAEMDGWLQDAIGWLCPDHIQIMTVRNFDVAAWIQQGEESACND